MVRDRILRQRKRNAGAPVPGFWFNDPADAAAAGCSNGVTPFNGEHNAGPQAMSTAQFPVLAGPLKHVKV